MAFPQNILDFLNQPQGQQQPPVDIVQGVLTNRFKPQQSETTFQDVGNAALAGISNNSYVDPGQYADERMANSMKQLAMVQKLNGGEAPSSVREYQYFTNLPPDKQQQYLSVKRAQQIMNLGGSEAVYDPITGGLKTQFNKTLPPQDAPIVKGDQERARKVADITTTAQSELPKIADQADIAVSNIDSALNSPGLDANFGMSGMVPNRPGSDASDAKAILDQIKGGAFLTAYGQLRGGGAITEIEGEKATNAYSRMQTAQSAKAFRAAAKEYINIVNMGVKRARDLASGSTFNNYGAAQPVNITRQNTITPPTPEEEAEYMRIRGGQ